MNGPYPESRLKLLSTWLGSWTRIGHIMYGAKTEADFVSQPPYTVSVLQTAKSKHRQVKVSKGQSQALSGRRWSTWIWVDLLIPTGLDCDSDGSVAPETSQDIANVGTASTADSALVQDKLLGADRKCRHKARRAQENQQTHLAWRIERKPIRFNQTSGASLNTSQEGLEGE